MRLSSLADYAVVMMCAVARHCGGVARLNATVLAEDTGIPLPTVQKLVSRLSAAGLIESSRGTGGGFRLSRPPSAIDLAEMIEAIEGPIALTSCIEHASRDCKAEDTCQVKPHWNVINGAVRGALASVSLATLSSLPDRRGRVAEPPLSDRSASSREPSRLDPGMRRGSVEVPA